VYVALSTDTSAATTLETSAGDGNSVENAIDFSFYILFSMIQKRHLNKVRNSANNFQCRYVYAVFYMQLY